MKYFVILFLLVINLSAEVSTIKINGKDYWLNGINLPWINWEDFDDPWGSNNYDHNKFDAAFKKYSENGINSVRVWVHCKGEGSPVLDSTGQVLGTSDVFWENFSDMLALANKYNLFVMPALFSFDIVDDKRTISKYSENSAENFKKFINSKDNVQSYIDNFLLEFIDRYDTNKAMFCYEICNEPEWMSENSGIDKNNVIRMHAMIAAAIHKNGNKPVTTGSASLKWTGQQYDYWSDDALQAQFADKDAYFDFYQIHYYDWMDPDGSDPYKFSPMVQTVSSLSSKLKGRPVIVGELPGDGGKYYSVIESYEKILKNGYAGAFGWSDFANDGVGTFEDISLATNYMDSIYGDYIKKINSNESIKNVSNNSKTELKIFPNPFNPSTTLFLNLNKSGLIKIMLYNATGELVNVLHNGNLGKGVYSFKLNGEKLASGVYFVKFRNGNVSYSKKIVLLK